MRTKTVFFLTMFGYLIPVPPAAADFTITYAQPGTSRTDTIYVSNGKVRVTNRKGKKEVPEYMIYDSNHKAMISVDRRRRRYTIMTEKDLDRIIRDMPTAEDMVTGKIQRKIPFSSWIPKKATEEPARKGAKAVVKGIEKTAPKVLPYEKRRVVKMKHRQTIKGVPCTDYHVYRNKNTTGVLCVASRRAVKMSQSDYRALKAFHGYTMKLTALTKNMAGPFSYRIDDFIMTNVDGVPLYGKESEKDRGLKMTGISRTHLPVDLFKVPKGYKKEEI